MFFLLTVFNLKLSFSLKFHIITNVQAKFGSIFYLAAAFWKS